MTKKEVGEERVYFSSSQKEDRKGTQTGQDLETGTDTEAMKGASYWLALCGFLSLLSFRTQDHETLRW